MAATGNREEESLDLGSPRAENAEELSAAPELPSRPQFGRISTQGCLRICNQPGLQPHSIKSLSLRYQI